VSRYLLGPYADNQLDEIYEYTAANSGEDQADRYINTLFEYFSDVASKNVTWRSVPAEFGVDGHLESSEVGRRWHCRCPAWAYAPN
jgi:toxin ParE1/3/4